LRHCRGATTPRGDAKLDDLGYVADLPQFSFTEDLSGCGHADGCSFQELPLGDRTMEGSGFYRKTLLGDELCFELVRANGAYAMLDHLAADGSDKLLLLGLDLLALLSQQAEALNLLFDDSSHLFAPS